MGRNSKIEELVDHTIQDILEDKDLCPLYPNLCSYSSSKSNRQRIVLKVIDLINYEGYDNLFDALAFIENDLNEGNNE